MISPYSLNGSALRVVDRMIERAAELRIAVSFAENGTRLIDCGVKVAGGIEAGRLLAEVCLAGLGSVKIGSCTLTEAHARWFGPSVEIAVDHPTAACMAAQYAGWQITGEKFFAMGSGPMRAAGSREALFEEIGLRERPLHAVGVLETSKLPPTDVCERIAADCGVAPVNLTLLAARTASLAGSIQVTARSVETALHKLHTLGFDLSHVEHGFGSAPLPPPAANDLAAIGRTNDAVLYGAEVTLYVRDTDERLAELTPRVPSCASPDFGRPFAEIFARAGNDFYKIDPLLFSPAAVRLVNLATGRCFSAGSINPSILQESFGS